ncbi:Protein SMG5 [Pontoporia blainvillei]|uniref:Protein SMG5 n=1 Tax=Pontoporia blainvillei TaxID=48723 RepID=A0ABX0S7K0_PONBL|nr:Protein SMG5 [Pontoporia blainvillei]
MAFDAKTDSEMKSQESRSDLEDKEDEEGTWSPALEPPWARSEASESFSGPLDPSEASTASNLQAMSTQMLQTKCCFQLAPTFSNLLLQPTAEAPTLASPRPCVRGDVDKPSEPASEEGSESEGSESNSGRACWNERSIQEKLQVLMAEGQLPAVKVFLDWLRTNRSLFTAAHRCFNFDTDQLLLSTLEETVVHICCIHSFGHFIARLHGSILQFNPEVSIFVSISQSEQESLLQQARAQFRMAQEEAQRNGLMRDMAQL